MKISVHTDINATKAAVWETITNIEGAAERISGIQKIEVLEKPKSGLVGLKWKEERIMFGKTATEVMWVTAATEQKSYDVRAESHGMIYESQLRLEEAGNGTRLTMEFGGTPQTFMARVMGVLMSPFFKKATIKALQQDMDDIKASVESS